MTTVLTLCAYHLRLLVRDRAKLAAIAALPVLAGVVLSLASGGTNRVPTYGLFAVLPVSALLMALTLRADGLLPGVPNELVSLPTARVSEALATLGVIAAQAVVYVVLAGILAGAPEASSVVAALVLSLAVGTASSFSITPEIG